MARVIRKPRRVTPKPATHVRPVTVENVRLAGSGHFLKQRSGSGWACRCGAEFVEGKTMREALEHARSIPVDLEAREAFLTPSAGTVVSRHGRQVFWRERAS